MTLKTDNDIQLVSILCFYIPTPDTGSYILSLLFLILAPVCHSSVFSALIFCYLQLTLTMFLILIYMYLLKGFMVVHFFPKTISNYLTRSCEY